MPTPNYLIIRFKQNRMSHQQVAELPPLEQYQADPDIIIYRADSTGGFSFLSINPERQLEWHPVPTERT